MDISQIKLIFNQDSDGDASVRVVVYLTSGQVVEAQTALDATTITVKFDDRVEMEA